MDLFDLSFAKHKIYVNRTKFWGVFVLVLIVLIFDIIWLVTDISNRWRSVWDIRFFILLPVFILIGFLTWRVVWFIFKRLDRKMDEYAYNIEIATKGDNGEEIVNKELKNILPQDHKIFRNRKLPGKKSDLDFIIVSSKGICLLEVKNHDTHTIFTHDTAYFTDKTNYLIPLPFKKDVREIVKWQSTELKKYLFDHKLGSIPVHKAAVYVNPNSVEIRDGGKNKYEVYVVKGLDGLQRFINNTYIDPKFNPEFRLKVCEVLSRL